MFSRFSLSACRMSFFIFVFLFNGCDRGSEGDVTVTHNINNKTYSAQILCLKSKSTCYLKVKRIDSGQLVLEKKMDLLWGYHDPVVTLTYMSDRTGIRVRVDHDFGDGVIEKVYEF